MANSNRKKARKLQAAKKEKANEKAKITLLAKFFSILEIRKNKAKKRR